MRNGSGKEREGGKEGGEVESLTDLLEHMGSHRCRCLVYSGRIAFVSRWAHIAVVNRWDRITVVNSFVLVAPRSLTGGVTLLLFESSEGECEREAGNEREKVESLNGILEQIGSHRCRSLVYSDRIAFVSRWAPIAVVNRWDRITVVNSSVSFPGLFGSNCIC